MKLRNKRRNRNLANHSSVQASIERVENRCLLAGVVGVSLSNSGNLTITGDDAGNSIEIGNVNDDFGYVNAVGGTQLEYNGMLVPSMQFPLTIMPTVAGDFPGLDGNLTINMGDGDDSVLIEGTDGPLAPAVIHGDLNVQLGDGHDQYNQTISYAGGDVEIRGSDGSDTINLEELVFNADTYIHGGHAVAGSDGIYMNRAHFMNVEVRGSSGETLVMFTDSTVAEDMEVATGNNNDEFWMMESFVAGDLDLDTGAADSNIIPGDYVLLSDGGVVGDLTIDGRGGMQTIDFTAGGMPDDFTVVGKTKINTRGGNDRIFLDDVETQTFMDDVQIKTGGGHDMLDIQALTVFEQDLSINMGGGHDDILFSVMVAVGGDGQLKGGGGSDSISSDYLFATWSEGVPDLLSIENVI